MKTQTNCTTKSRSAFTLLELLIVIVIISILLGLIGVGLSSARQGVNVAETIIELSQLETAIAAFESEFGVAPYSEITLYETGTAWTPSEKAKIRKIWPDYPFTDIDINNDDDTDDQFTAVSSEALVFFLGGLERSEEVIGTGIIQNKLLNGFAKNPFAPLSRDGENRTGPFYDFDDERLTDLDDDGFYEYHGINSPDPLSGETDPIVYASSNSGRGYSDSAGAVNHYHFADGATPWNKDSFQLIAPGRDGKLGFDELLGTAPKWSAGSGPSGGTSPQDQADNITNFADSVLGN